MFKRLITTALVFGAAALAPPADAQSRATCFDRDTLIVILKDRFNETLTGGGLQDPGQFLEIWSSQTTGSFTVFITYPTGMSCVVASGNDWHNASTEPEGIEG